VTSNERATYLACVDRQLDSCEDAFDESIAEVVADVEANFEYNEALLEEAETYQSACATAFTTAQAAISEWQETGSDYEIYYDSATCADDDLSLCEVDCSPDRDDNSTCTCSEVSDMVGDIGAVRSEAFTHATDYKDYSTSTVGSMASYSVARAAYDAAFIYNHTEGLREPIVRAMSKVSLPHIKGINFTFGNLVPDADVLVGCVSLRDATNHSGCFPGVDSARQLYDEIREKLEAQLATARSGFQEYADEGALLWDNVESAYDNTKYFYDGFNDWVSSAGIDTTDAGDWLDLSLSDFTVAEPSWPSGVGITTNIAPVPGANYVYNAVDEIFKAFLTNITLASLGTVDLANDWWDDLAEALDSFPAFSPDDYDPPEYSEFTDNDDAGNVTQAAKQHEDESDAFLAKEAVALNAYAELEQYQDDDFSFQTYNFSISEEAYTLVSGLYFPFEPLSKSTIDFDIWMISVGNIAGLFVVLDYVYRGYRSFVIFARFWGRASLAIPDADMRIDRDQVKCRFMTPRVVAFNVLTSPFMWGALYTVFFAIFVFFLCQMYVPIYNQYIDGCVVGETNGTFISNNLYSIAYNYASEDGNEKYFNGMEDYNIEKVDYCSAYSTSSQEQQNEDGLFMDSLKTSQKATRDDMYLMEQCIDSSTMDELFQKACCGKTNYDDCSTYGTDDGWYNSSWKCPINDYSDKPFQTVGEYVAEAGCDEPSAWSDWDLKDAVFYCTDVPDCTITCGGPNKEIIRTTTEQCGCMLEWLIHAVWVKFSLAAVIYILMNVSRMLFTRACCKVFWEHLSPKVFTYTATCDEKGRVLAPEKADQFHHFTGEDGALKSELDRTLARYVEAAKWEVLFAALLNVPWIVFLSLVDHTLTYDPNAQS